MLCYISLSYFWSAFKTKEEQGGEDEKERRQKCLLHLFSRGKEKGVVWLAVSIVYLNSHLNKIWKMLSKMQLKM